jgi:hypothetical protein
MDAAQRVLASGAAWLEGVTAHPPPVDAQLVLVAAGTMFVCAAVTAVQPAWVGIMSRSRNVSTLHSAVVVSLAVRAYFDVAPLLWDPSGAIWTARIPSAALPVAITTGYIAYDVALGLAFPGQLDAGMWAHHAIVLLSYVTGLSLGFATPYAALFLVNEASTIPLNWHYQWCGRQRGCVRTTNGTALWLAYLVCRMVANTVLTASVVTTSSPAVRAAFPVAWGIQMFVLAVLTALNANWFYRITRGFVKALTGAPPSSRHEAAHIEGSDDGLAAAAAAAAAVDDGGGVGKGAAAAAVAEGAALVPPAALKLASVPTPSESAHPTPASDGSASGRDSGSSSAKARQRRRA